MVRQDQGLFERQVNHPVVSLFHAGNTAVQASSETQCEHPNRGKHRNSKARRRDSTWCQAAQSANQCESRCTDNADLKKVSPTCCPAQEGCYKQRHATEQRNSTSTKRGHRRSPFDQRPTEY